MPRRRPRPRSWIGNRRASSSGVVAFSDSGLSVQVPTRDQAAVLAAIARLNPERGTSLTQGIGAALDAIIDAEEGVVTGYYTSRSPAPEAASAPVARQPRIGGGGVADRRRGDHRP